MESVRDDLEDLAKRINDERMVAGADEIPEAAEKRDAVAEDLAELTRPKGFKRHLVEYIKDEKAAYEAGDRVYDDDEDGEGQKPLCTCSNPYCALKQGKLPPRVTIDGDIDEGITEYIAGHRGDPHVLSEARTDWIQTFTHVRSELESVLAIYRHENYQTDESEA